MARQRLDRSVSARRRRASVTPNSFERVARSNADAAERRFVGSGRSLESSPGGRARTWGGSAADTRDTVTRQVSRPSTLRAGAVPLDDLRVALLTLVFIGRDAAHDRNQLDARAMMPMLLDFAPGGGPRGAGSPSRRRVGSRRQKARGAKDRNQAGLVDLRTDCGLSARTDSGRREREAARVARLTGRWSGPRSTG